MLPGIDVSAYQGTIIWRQVHAAGYVWAGMKASEGLLYHDPTFPYNWEHSKERGLRRIAYHFFHANESGNSQADYFHGAVRRAGGFEPGDCAMVDVETTNGMSASAIVRTLEVFIQRFLATTSCGLYVYTGNWFWDGVMGGPRSKIAGTCPLWTATYGPAPVPVDNWPTGPAIWQWSETVHVPGIQGNVDGDRFLGTLDQYNILASEGGR